ncbi:tetratricopeptide repeat protein [candidate division KSB1 bacterium]|nr:tetratricopeptide repeat protein [candidate division KSB1 bacterium]
MKELVCFKTNPIRILFLLLVGLQANSAFCDPEFRNPLPEQLRRGNTCLQSGKHAEAIAVFDSLVLFNPSNPFVPVALWNTANIYWLQWNDPLRGAETYQQIIDGYPDSEWSLFAYQRLGECLEKQQYWSSAAESYKTLLHKISHLRDHPFGRAEITSIKQHLLTCYRNTDDKNGALNLYLDFLSQDSLSYAAAENQFGLAQVYLELEKTQQAARQFARLIDRYPASPFALQVQDAHSALLEKELNFDWSRFSSFIQGISNSRIGRFEEADSIFNRIIRDDPGSDFASAATLQKEVLEFRRDCDPNRLLSKLGAFRRNNPHGYSGVNLDDLRIHLQDLKLLKETIAGQPDQVDPLIQAAWICYRLASYPCGIRLLETAATLDPEVPEVYHALGYFYLACGNSDAAIGMFEKMTKVAPENPNSWDSLAEGYYIKGDKTTAAEFYQKALALDTGFSNAGFMLGRIYHEIGEKELAVVTLKKYLALDPGSLHATEAQQILASLSIEN